MINWYKCEIKKDCTLWDVKFKKGFKVYLKIDESKKYFIVYWNERNYINLSKEQVHKYIKTLRQNGKPIIETDLNLEKKFQYILATW